MKNIPDDGILNSGICFHKAKSRGLQKIKESRHENSTRNCGIKTGYRSETEALYAEAIFGNCPYLCPCGYWYTTSNLFGVRSEQ